MSVEIKNFGVVPNADALPPAVVEGLVISTTSGFGRPIGDTRDHLHADRLFVVEDTSLSESDPARYKGFSAVTFGSLQGFLGREFPDERGCYFSGSVLDTSVQHQRLYPLLNDMRVAAGLEEGLTLFANRTQNGHVADETVRAFDRAIARGDIAGFDLALIPLPQAYAAIGGMLTQDLPPQATDPRIAEEFRRLDLRAGDAMGFLIHVTPVRDRRGVDLSGVFGIPW